MPAAVSGTAARARDCGEGRVPVSASAVAFIPLIDWGSSVTASVRFAVFFCTDRDTAGVFTVAGVLPVTAGMATLARDTKMCTEPSAAIGEFGLVLNE